MMYNNKRMHFFIILFFFTHLCHSFTLVNRKLVNRKFNHGICMGCDYYIETTLWIHYDKGFGYVILSKDKGYYNNISKITDKILKNYHLEPKTKPIVIYENNTFINESVLNKYKSLLDKEIIQNDDKKWHHVKKIVMAEHRYERE